MQTVSKETAIWILSAIITACRTLSPDDAMAPAMQSQKWFKLVPDLKIIHPPGPMHPSRLSRPEGASPNCRNSASAQWMMPVTRPVLGATSMLIGQRPPYMRTWGYQAALTTYMFLQLGLCGQIIKRSIQKILLGCLQCTETQIK